VHLEIMLRKDILDILNQVQLRNQGFQTLNVDALLHDTRLYARIVSMKSNLAISRQVICDTYLGKIKNFKFRDYLVRSGFREVDSADWPSFINRRVIEFNEAQLAIRMMGLGEVRTETIIVTWGTECESFQERS
jgi:hypothetical protein